MLTGDQKVYISIALEMKERGSWLTPYLFGEPSYLKPPLQYWATLLSWKFGGVSLLTTFLPSVLMLWIGSWLLGEISGLLGEKKWKVTTGLWFAGTLGAWTYGTTSQMEIYLVTAWMAGWYFVLQALAPPTAERRYGRLFLAFFFAGLLSLIKSPLYSVLWTLSFLIYLLIAGEWLVFRERKLYGALLFGVLVGASWYLAILVNDRERFISQYVLQETFAKGSGNGGTPLGLWGALLMMALPTTPLLVPAFRELLRARRAFRILRLVLAWTLPLALFFSFYPYRVHTYLFPLLPMVALIIDWGAFRSGHSKLFRWTTRLTGVLLSSAFLLTAILLWDTQLASKAFVLAALVLALTSMLTSWTASFRGLLGVSLGLILFLRGVSTEIAERDYIHLSELIRTSKFQSLSYDDRSRNIWSEVGFLSVTLKRPIQRILKIDEALDQLEKTPGHAWILSDETWKNEYVELSSALSKRGIRYQILPWRRLKARKGFLGEIFGSRTDPGSFEESVRRNYILIVSQSAPRS